jgi:hypothetical protein
VLDVLGLSGVIGIAAGGDWATVSARAFFGVGDPDSPDNTNPSEGASRAAPALSPHRAAPWRFGYLAAAEEEWDGESSHHAAQDALPQQPGLGSGAGPFPPGAAAAAAVAATSPAATAAAEERPPRSAGDDAKLDDVLDRLARLEAARSSTAGAPGVSAGSGGEAAWIGQRTTSFHDGF